VPRPRKKKGDKPADRRIKDLTYGPPKTAGKTHFLGTAADDERTAPMAVVDLEGGVLDVLETHPGWGTDLIHIPITDKDSLNEAYERVYQNDEGFKSFGIDSLSETHIFFLMNILDIEHDKREAKGNSTDLIEQGDYGIGLVQLRRFVRYWRDLPIHGFYVAHDKEDTDPREGRITTVNLAGKAATEIPGMMSAYGYLTQEETEEGELLRVMLLKNYAKIRTGVRAGWGIEVPDEIYDPTVTKLLDALGYTH
jgi:hypothetical protein